jgi:hypothetical protein
MLGWSEIFEAASVYALADGALALITAAVLLKRRRRIGVPFLPAITLANALVLVSAGVAVRAWPGISGFPMTLVMFYGIVGVWAASLGAMAITMSIRVIERDRGADRPRRIRDLGLVNPIVISGLVAIVFVADLLVAGPPSSAERLRRVAAFGAALLAVVFLMGSIGVFLRRD